MITSRNSEEISVKMRSLTQQGLGERLEQERARRFVGRADELELIRRRLVESRSESGEADLFGALWVHGPGGIGKSTLLAAYARAASAGCAVAEVDCGRIMPSPDSIRTAMNDSLISSGGRNVQPCLIIIDSAERLGPAENWLREEFLPALPGHVVAVIASRRPPDAAGMA
jgi:hypothetical protein